MEIENWIWWAAEKSCPGTVCAGNQFSLDKILWELPTGGLVSFDSWKCVGESLFTCWDIPNIWHSWAHMCLLCSRGQLLGSDGAGHRRGDQHTFLDRTPAYLFMITPFGKFPIFFFMNVPRINKDFKTREEGGSKAIWTLSGNLSTLAKRDVPKAFCSNLRNLYSDCYYDNMWYLF